MSEEAILVTSVGGAAGAGPAAAALACAAADPDRAGLLIDLTTSRAPRAGLVATAAARALEERLAAHLQQVGVASRGQVCQLTLSPDAAGIEAIAAALAVGRGSTGVLHLPPQLLHAVLEEGRIRPFAAMLRADLGTDRALTALAARALSEQGVRVGVLKRPLGWIAARRALVGILSPGAAGGLPPRLLARLLPVPTPPRGAV
jgi:hypothetical protein